MNSSPRIPPTWRFPSQFGAKRRVKRTNLESPLGISTPPPLGLADQLKCWESSQIKELIAPLFFCPKYKVVVDSIFKVSSNAALWNGCSSELFGHSLKRSRLR
jgi:hypothetical protein